MRPRPYRQTAWVNEQKIQPGTILAGKMIKRSYAKYPHIEDADIVEELKNVALASNDLFKTILEQTLSDSIADGFGYKFWH